MHTTSLAARAPLAVYSVIVIYVIGSIAVDLVAQRSGYRRGTSNPAIIDVRVGGVGYNIYARLTSPRRLITAVADDALGGTLREEVARDPGIQALPSSLPTAVYMALMDRGELLYGAADMAGIRGSLDAPGVLEALGELRPGDIVVLEANLSAPTTAQLLAAPPGGISRAFECVSVEKAREHGKSLRNLQVLSGTAEEIEAASAAREPGALLEFMRERRIDSVIQSRGAEGVTLTHDGTHLDVVPGCRVDCRDTTGAGDALMASLLDALAGGEGIEAATHTAVNAVVDFLKEER